MRRFLKNYSTQGFTLLEVMIAMAIMVVTMTSILLVQSLSINAASKSKNLAAATMLAKNLMLETESELTNKAFTELKEEETGNFESPYEFYSWKREIKEVKFPEIQIAQSEEETQENQSQQQMIKQVQQLISKHLTNATREVTITVTYPDGSGEDRFKVTTYLVNMEKGFDLTL